LYANLVDFGSGFNKVIFLISIYYNVYSLYVYTCFISIDLNICSAIYYLADLGIRGILLSFRSCYDFSAQFNWKPLHPFLRVVGHYYKYLKF